MPSSTRALARGSPLLVAAPEQTTFELRSRSGANIGLSSLFTAPRLGLCGGTYSILAANEVLDSSETYVLVSTTVAGQVSESEPFTVAQDGLAVEAIPLTLTATLEAIEPVTFGSGLCVDTQLEDRPLDTLLHVHVSAPLRAPLVVTAHVDDSVSGSLNDALAPSPAQTQGDVYLTLSLPPEASHCADVELVDLNASPIFHELLCPVLDSPVTRTLNPSLLVVPEPDRTQSLEHGCSLTPRSHGPSRGMVLITCTLALLALRGQSRSRRRVAHV